MAVENLGVLKMVSELSFGSYSITSRNMREYAEIVESKENRYPTMLTDLRNKQTPAEEATGKVFTTSA